MNSVERADRALAITKELDAMAVTANSPNDFLYEGWNSQRMRVYIAAKLAAMEEANTSLAEKLEFEKAVGERVVKVFKDAIKQDEKSSS